MTAEQSNPEMAELHRRMLKIATPNDGARFSWKRGRTRYLTALRLVKLGFMVRQRYAARRVLNLLVFLIERRRARKVHYLAPVVTVEAINGCNLHCPECPTGMSSPASRKKGKATLEDLKSVVDQICKKSVQINFHHMGEPLLNDDFYAACAYAVEKGLWTAVHSNLNIRAADLSRRIVSSRLCNLVVSCDGATQEVYEKYRVGGDVELVFRNMRSIAEHKRTMASRFPWITAQFIVFDHNWHEMERFRERAMEAGADEILFLPGCRNGTAKSGHVWEEEVFNLSRLAWEPRQAPAVCGELWETPILTYDGGLYPCCFCFRDQDLFAPRQSPSGRTLVDHWNGHAYRTARAFFLGDPVRREDLPQPCRCCGRTTVRLHDLQAGTNK
ncbi:MAG: radical SAM protein [Phycisphaerae bacterium]|nr:radical SAM protein [Phycisphaerae bacterium]